jgi:hypothetical protein
VEGLRVDKPLWGNRKVKPVLRVGVAVSDASAGRIFAHLVRRPTRVGAEGLRNWARRRLRAR